jgi:hypothetical protein
MVVSLFAEHVINLEKTTRLDGCAGSLEPTRLSLHFGEMQGDLAKLQGKRRLTPAENLGISIR